MKKPMRIWPALSSLPLLALSAAGCHAHHEVPVGSNAPDAPVVFPDGATGYLVAAGASAGLPALDRGFIVTVNGAGGYRVAWSDLADGDETFSGTITADAGFDPTQVAGYSGRENITLSPDNSTITFSSSPGNNLDGVDMVSNSDPIILDALVDGSRQHFDIVFTGADSGNLIFSQFDPVAFASD